jgi:molecular chaperone GrpE
MSEYREPEADEQPAAEPEADLEEELEAVEASEQEVSEALEITARDLRELQQKAEDAEKYLDAARRAKADFLNYQKRMERDRLQIRELATRDVARDMLGFIDKFRHSMDKAGEFEDFDSLFSAMQMVQSELQSFMQRLGLKRIDAVGRKFNPDLHEAMMNAPTREHEPGTVIEEIRSGYLLGEHVLQPAQVVVAKQAQE